MKAASPERKTITVTEAAKLLGIGKNQAYEAARRGEIPVIRIGRRILVPVAALERLLRAGEYSRATTATTAKATGRSE
jgi:excisionase family DNA binding protein